MPRLRMSSTERRADRWASRIFRMSSWSPTAVTDTADVTIGEEINFPDMPFTRFDIGGVGPTTVSTGLFGEFHNASFVFVAFGWQSVDIPHRGYRDPQSGIFDLDIDHINRPDHRDGMLIRSSAIGTTWPRRRGILAVTSWNDASFTATLARGGDGDGGGDGNVVPSPNAAWLSLIACRSWLLPPRHGL